MKKILAYPTLAFFVIFSVSCATVTPSGSPRSSSLPSIGRIDATKFLEVLLITTNGDQQKGKILCLERDTVSLLPFPYWSVDPLRIGLDEIHSIEKTEEKTGGGKGFLYGFGVTALIVGIMGSANSRYNTQYRSAMAYTPLCGLVGGLLGVAIGGGADLATRSKYDLSRMAKDEKIAALMAIMGL